MTELPLSEWPAMQNGLFILFLSCFLITALLLENSRHLFAFMFRNLLRKQDRKAVFSETIHNEFLFKFALCLQAVAMISILVYCGISHLSNLPVESTSRFISLSTGTALRFSVYLLGKFLIYFFTGCVFFQMEDMRLWINHYFSIIAFSGIALLLPALLIFYLPSVWFIGFYFGVAYLLLAKTVVIYNIFTIFFHQKSPFFYYFLYLCAQEFLPLFLVLKALVHFYSL
jgi:hypothetical protein